MPQAYRLRPLITLSARGGRRCLESWCHVEKLETLELLFLHRIVCRRTDEVAASIRRCQALEARGVDKQESLILLESELNAISSIRDKVVEEISLRRLLGEMEPRKM